jgi:hypothetical protein
VYDKDFYDYIIAHDVAKLRNALLNESHLPHSVMFLDNHDEERVASRLGIDQLRPAIVLQATLPGLKLYYKGQEEGSKIKLPMQLGRRPYEPVNQEVYDWHQKVFAITSDPVFVLGDFEIVNSIKIDEQNNTCQNLLAFKRTYKQQTYLIVANYSIVRSKGFVPYVPEVNEHLTTVVFADQLTGVEYPYKRDSLMTHHLYVELSPWQCHVFRIKEVV